MKLYENCGIIWSSEITFSRKESMRTNKNGGFLMINFKTFRAFKVISLVLFGSMAVSLASCGGGSSSSIVPMTAITVSGAGGASTITINGGTLQMSAVVTPVDTSNKAIVWSVTDATGEAHISSGGLLTAVADGNVLVKATSVSLPTINGTLSVTISNQAATSKAALVSAIAAAIDNKSTVSDSVSGSDVWPDAIWATTEVLASYQTAIDTAQAVVDDAVATQLAVDNAVTALQTATATFNDDKASGTRIANMALLISAIASANDNKASAVVSVDGSDVMPANKWVRATVKTSYETAIASAQTVVDTAGLKQDVVDNAVTALAAATLIFNNAKQDGTKVVVAAQRVELGLAGNYAVLAKSAVSTTGTTMVTGDVAVSPAAGSYITGFSETLDASNNYATSAYVTGHIYASDFAEPTPTTLTTAIANMETAYTTGVGFAPDATELFAGDLSGQTMTAGVYKWGNNVLINTDLTLNGSSTDVWVFQIAGTLTEAANIHITLSGGANPANIFWLVADSVSIGVGAHAEGIILGVTDIAMGTNSSINGRLLAQTAVTLDATTVVQPS